MGSRCLNWSTCLQILFAAMVLMEGSAGAGDVSGAVAPGRMPRSTIHNQMVPDRHYCANHWRDHLGGKKVVGVSSKLSAERRSYDRTATIRHQLQQTSTRTEVEVLMAFKEGVTDDSLGALSNWNSNDSDACHWNGVTCNLSNTITALELRSFQLMGTISALLGQLMHLETLDLSNNSFSGEIPTSLLNCSRLSYLALRNNNLTGHIPSQVGDLLHLQSLDLGYNVLLGGPIPASLSNCSLLGHIHLDYTGLSGEIPSSLGQLAHLESLNLTNTFNSGSIPKSLGNCTYLTFLEVGNVYEVSTAASNPNSLEDELSGELPAELGNLKRLKTLQIQGTSIQGAFPPCVANLTALTTLALAHSSFSGEIPEFLGSLPLEYLNLDDGIFSGAIPISISNCTNMWYLAIVNSPNISGAIPPELGKLTKLGALYLAITGLTSTIPSSLSNCSRLRVLVLGQNDLVAPQPVPSWIASLVNLTYLFLSDMNLQGEIPTSLGEVSKLDHLWLWGNQLSGAIPGSLANCTSLVHLELEDNLLSGEVPPEIWTLSQLNVFLMGDNLLTGTLPAAINNLSLLQSFRCEFNFFSGEIPSKVGSLQSLELAKFDFNYFDGFIPQSLGNCSALIILNLRMNDLSGPIPSSLGNLTGLEYLELSTNRIEGTIPVNIMRCTALGYLNLSGNLLVGSIPQEIGQLVSLQVLDVSSNKLSGELPSSLDLLTNLLYLDLSSNQFYGTVLGEAIASISSNLNLLNVSHNHLSGSLPSELGKLTVVYYLDFSVNNFSGSIPSDLQNCESLQTLDLSINNFSGGIPVALAQLQDLEFVNVSFNHLQGQIPEGGVFNSTNLTSASFLGNPGLCGSILKGCPVGDPSPTSARAPSCKSKRCDRLKTTIILVCTGVGVVLISSAAVVLICWLFHRDGKKCSDVPTVVTLCTESGLRVSEQELLSIIERPENMIGVGGTSTVYKGVLSGGNIIAIKVLSIQKDHGGPEYSQQVATQCFMEASTLFHLKHRNILKVLGVLSTPSLKALILEFMPNASLHNQLYDVEECKLNWDARLNIALGVAQGMVYLHSHAHVPVIHRDLKPSNIFLDADLEPKLGDFGISQCVNPDKSGDGETTASNFCGTFGYFPPEYGATTKVSTKGDVYSYGVILLQLLTRKRPIVAVADSEESDLGRRGQQTKHLVDWVLELCNETPLAVVDPLLLINEKFCTSHGPDDNNSYEQMKLLMQVGLLCTQDNPQSRPQMNDVLAMLVQIKERGLNPAHRPTVAELAEKSTVWPIPEQIAAAKSCPDDHA